MPRIRSAVILVAGLGSRMLPATKAVPKELLPIVDKPLVQYCVEEAVAAGMDRVIFVTAEGKEAIAEHFAAGARVELALREAGNNEAAERAKAPSGLASFEYVTQERALGIAHAVNCARAQLQGEAFALMFPDDLILGRSCIGELAEAHAQVGGSVIAVEPVVDAEVSQYGIIDPIETTNPARLRAVVEKPALQAAPSRLGIVGRYILSETIFEHIDRIPPGAKGELQITDALASQIAAGEPVSAFQFSGARYDTGRPLGLIVASIAAAMQRPDLAPALAARMPGLLATETP